APNQRPRRGPGRDRRPPPAGARGGRGDPALPERIVGASPAARALVQWPHRDRRRGAAAARGRSAFAIGHRRGRRARHRGAPLHRRPAGSRSAHTHQRRDADLEFPAVAAGLYRALGDRHAMARLPEAPPLPGRGRLPETGAPLRPSGLKPAPDPSLPLRVLSGAIFIPILVALAWLGGYAFLALVALEVTLGLVEFYRMMRAKGFKPYRRVGWLAAMGLLWVMFRPQTPHADFLLTALLLLVLGLELRQPEATGRVEHIALSMFGVLYVGWLSGHLVLLRELPLAIGRPYAAGMSYVLLAFFV